MPKVTVQVRTRHNLLELLAAGESPAWKVGKDREPTLTHVQIVNFDGTQMIEAVYGRNASERRRDGDLVIPLLDGRIVNCQVKFSARNPVRIISDSPDEM